MAQEDGLFAVMQDLAAGKSISLPAPVDLETIFITHGARRIEAQHRNSADERFHIAVAGFAQTDETS